LTEIGDKKLVALLKKKMEQKTNIILLSMSYLQSV